MSAVELYDATLRDGMGGGGMALTAEEKVRVVRRLDELGVDLIEAGFPASNPKERELFEMLAGEELANAEIVAFGMTRRRDTSAERRRRASRCSPSASRRSARSSARARSCTSRRSCGSRARRTSR